MPGFTPWFKAHSRASEAERTLHGRMRAGELPDRDDLAYTTWLRAEASELLVAMLSQMREVAQALRYQRVQKLRRRRETHDRST